jgi:chromosome segregation ATPase
MNKYGPPVKCEICQQTCAFNRSDLRIDGKLHCWLCKLSYKRALAKAKKSDIEKHKERAKKRSADDGIKSGSMKLSNQSSTNRNNNANAARDLSKDIPEKIQKTSNSVIAPIHHQSDHVVALTQLKEQIATLQKKLQQKDNQLLQKDKEITEWKGKHFAIETEMRTRMTDQKKVFETKCDIMNKKIQHQQVQIATLSKSTKRSTKESVKEREKDNSSGTDSPNTN